ncbi:T9SS type A sorting domain-containing protein [Hymenobacter endophyticus]|uniref:T9SS type A sorting domain-containing protein n=1 Tax=Hymenobacter endophyticus TaxID=3076335 RepID=A0ABU3TDJ0_9BACT|nr:T9SS type A sorting domain-containing protein [Hymenobacter endophyticus]MDU0369410.1 T9SS type A sorting domain-containing protein [Hymenobacter endophyticus]
MRLPHFAYLFAGLLLSSCDGTLTSWLPAASFDPIVGQRPVNLARVLGPDVTLLGSADTLRLRISFAPASGITTIVAADSSQNPLYVRAFRFRGYYYLVETLPDARQWVHAVRIRRNTVQGLGTGLLQMENLSHLVQQGHWPELVRYRNAKNDSIRLRFSRKTLRTFFEAQADSLPLYRIQPPTKPEVVPRGVANGLPATPTYSVYPNPAQLEATVEFGSNVQRVIRLYTTAGVLLHTYSTSTHQLTFSVAHLPAGTYVLRVLTGAAGAAAPLRLVVMH